MRLTSAQNGSHTDAGHDDEKPGEGDYKEVIESLEKAIRQHSLKANILLAASAILAIGGVTLMTILFVRDIHAIDDAKHPELVMAFITLKSAAIAGAVTAVIYGTMTFARAAMDQVTRFQKRLSSARFLHYVMVANEAQLQRSKFNLKTVMKFMESWTANVESAYTNVRVGGPRRQQNILLHLGKDGVTLSQKEPPKAAKEKKRVEAEIEASAANA